MQKCCREIIKMNIWNAHWRIYFCVAVGLLYMAGCQSGSVNRIPETHQIIISSMQFNPAELTIQKGDTVVFVNQDLVVHDITENPGTTWSSSKLSPGQSYKIAIRATSGYYCSIHPSMKGKLIVEK